SGAASTITRPSVEWQHSRVTVQAPFYSCGPSHPVPATMNGVVVNRRRSLHLNRSIGAMILVTVLAFGSGCAQTDWIQRTLATVVVTGRGLDTGGTFNVTLKQEGSKVTGPMTLRGSFITASGTVSGAIAGDVAGDVFRFKQTGGIDIGATGEMTVSGDEMTGIVWWTAGRRDMTLRRID